MQARVLVLLVFIAMLTAMSGCGDPKPAATSGSDEDTAKMLLAEYHKIKVSAERKYEDPLANHVQSFSEVLEKRNAFLQKVKQERSPAVQILFEKLRSQTSSGLGRLTGEKIADRATICSQGTHVIFQSTLALDPEHKEVRGLAFYLWRIRDGKVELVSDKTSGNQIPDMSGDASQVAYVGLIIKERPSGDLIRVTQGNVQLMALGQPNKSIGKINRCYSEGPSLSSDGSKVVFSGGMSEVNRDMGIDEQAAFVVLFDKTTGACRALTPKPGNPDKIFEPIVSGDGSTVVLLSVPGIFDATSKDFDSWGIYTVRTKDGKASRIQLPQGLSWNLTEMHKPRRPYAISADGTRIAIQAILNKVPQIYVYDSSTSKLTLVSAMPDGKPGSRVSVDPAISGNGRFLVFSSSAELLPGLRGQQVLLHDIESGKLQLISHNAKGQPADGGCWQPSISHDGSAITLLSNADDLAGAPRSRGIATELYVYSTQSKKCLSLTDSLRDGNP